MRNIEIKDKVWTYDSNNYQEVYLDWKYRAIVKIQEDGCYPHPRLDFDNVGYLVMRETRDYKFPNELDFNRKNYENDYEYWDEKLENEFEKLCEDYYIFWIDMYDHSWIIFSPSWKGMQCQFDTTRWIWFRAIPKKYNWYDMEEIHRTKYTEKDEGKYMLIEVTEEQAKKIFSWELKDWNTYCSWEIYWYEVEKRTKWTSENWKVEYRYDTIDSCSWYYDKDQAKDEAVAAIESDKK